MRFTLAMACAFALAAASLFAQPDSNRSQSQAATVYSVAVDITPPVLLPSQPIEISNEKCKKKNQRTEEVSLSLFVTSDGKPRRLYFLRALGNDIDKKILDLVSEDKFTPALRNGEPVAVWQSVSISFQMCKENSKDKNSFPSYQVTSQPLQKLFPLADPPQPDQTTSYSSTKDQSQPNHIGSGLSVPVPVITPEARYSSEGRRKKINGVCLVSLTVDAQGMPQNPRMVRSLGYGLDEEALEAVMHYRFRPALKRGFEPVPVRLTVEINFRLY